MGTNEKCTLVRSGRAAAKGLQLRAAARQMVTTKLRVNLVFHFFHFFSIFSRLEAAASRPKPHLRTVEERGVTD